VILAPEPAVAHEREEPVQPAPEGLGERLEVVVSRQRPYGLACSPNASRRAGGVSGLANAHWLYSISVASRRVVTASQPSDSASSLAAVMISCSRSARSRSRRA
jgi:hypothetical protein